jgi:hypothetical protein
VREIRGRMRSGQILEGVGEESWTVVGVGSRGGEGADERGCGGEGGWILLRAVAHREGLYRSPPGATEKPDKAPKTGEGRRRGDGDKNAPVCLPA